MIDFKFEEELIAKPSEINLDVCVIDEAYCREIAARVAALPETLSCDGIQRYRTMLSAAPYTFMYKELEQVVTSETSILDRNKLERVRRLLMKGDALSLTDEGKAIASTPAYCGSNYQLTLINPRTEPILEFSRKLKSIGLCWSDDFNQESIAERLLEDGALGACIQLLGIENDAPFRKPKAYARLYVAETKEGERILFFDTLEGGKIDRVSLRTWKDESREAEPAMYLAAAMMIAETIGLTKIALGRKELEEIGDYIGVQEVRIFDRSQKYRKLGLQNYVYTFGIDGDTKRRMLDCNEIKPPTHKELEEKLEELRTYVTSHSKRLERLPQKRQEIQLYRDAIFGINEQVYQSRIISNKLSNYLGETSL